MFLTNRQKIKLIIDGYFFNKREIFLYLIHKKLLFSNPLERRDLMAGL